MSANAIIRIARGIKYLRKIIRKFGGRYGNEDYLWKLRNMEKKLFEAQKILRENKKINTKAWEDINRQIGQIDTAINLIRNANVADDHLRYMVMEKLKINRDQSIPKEMKPYERSYMEQQIDEVGMGYYKMMNNKNFLGNDIVKNFKPHDRNEFMTDIDDWYQPQRDD